MMNAISKNLQAFLDMIAFSEGTSRIADSDDGYRALVGGGTFESFADHPRVIVRLPNGIASSAAGRYQLLMRYWDAYKQSLHLTDFGPEAQDAVAIQQIRECKALPDIEAGRIETAISKCRHIWASFPGAGYAGQHEMKLAQLQMAYVNNGGTYA